MESGGSGEMNERCFSPLKSGDAAVLTERQFRNPSRWVEYHFVDLARATASLQIYFGDGSKQTVSTIVCTMGRLGTKLRGHADEKESHAGLE